MNRFLIPLLLLATLASAQRAPAPVLRFRQGNTNTLNLVISQAGQPLTPTTSTTITAELRKTDFGSVEARVPLSAVPSDPGLSTGPLPGLQPGLYILNLRVQRSTEPSYSVAVSRLEILPIGTLAAVSDQSGLNVQITETKQLVSVQLDATPTASVGAYYASLVRGSAGHIDSTATRVEGLTTTVTQQATSAANSATSAANSQTAAAGSAVSAATSATNAAGFATSAAGSATAAGNSATSAANSASIATAAISQQVGGLGDFSTTGWLWLLCGDSTTEQMKGVGYGMDRITQLRATGDRLAGLAGHINFGGSGYSLNSFLNDPVGDLPVIPTTGSFGPSGWDYYGHKPTGSISLATALAWRAGKTQKALWTICFGINDVILNASVGNMSQDQISDYIATRLRAVLTRILTAYPKDKVMLRIPNPMTARPYVSAAGYPSPGQYPTFGQDAATDQALVEKWNQGLRAGYLQVRNEMPSTILFDSWERVFGPSNTTLTATTQLPLLGDLVHPGATGNIELGTQLVHAIAPLPVGSSSRRLEAEQRATALGGNPWDSYPGYFRDNQRYKRVLTTSLGAAGSNYIDLNVSYTDFLTKTGNGGPIYLALADRAAQYFASYSSAAQGSGTRLFSLSPSASLQAGAGGQTVEIYQADGYQFIANDMYVDGQAKGAKEYYSGSAGGGNGYVDVFFSQVPGRISSKFSTGLSAGTLVVGGSVKTTLALSAATQVFMNGSAGQRAVRFIISGNYAAYAGQPAAITFSDDVPSPKAYEYPFSAQHAIPHAQNGRGVVNVIVPQASATLRVFTTAQISQDVAVEIFRVTFGSRTSLGVAIIPAGSASASISTTNVVAGTIYEYVITSATSHATGLVGLEVKPN